MGMSNLARAVQFFSEPPATKTVAATTLHLREDELALNVVSSGGQNVDVIKGNDREGTMLLLRGTDSTNTVTLRDNQSGTNLALASTTRVLGAGDIIVLRYGGTNWEEVSFSSLGTSNPLFGTDQAVISHEFFDDFTSLSTDWTVTEDSAGATQAVGDVNFGVVTLTNAATTDNDACQIQFAQETFQLIDGKELWFEARVKCAAGDATNLDFFVGLAEAEDLTGVADNMPANGLGFHKDDGDTNIDLSTSDGGTNIQSAAVGTLVDATWINLGFHFDGGSTGSGVITPYVNGTPGTAISTATYATMAELSPIVMIRNGDATTTQTIAVDYVKVIQQR